MAQTHTIAILGGTGQEGSGLALRWTKVGHRVILGSRDAAKAAAAAADMKATLSAGNINGTSNKEAAAAADIVMLTVPFAAQRKTVEEVRDALAGKILIDSTVPLVPPKVARVQLPAAGSAVAAIQIMLGANVRVVSAFQNVSAHHLKDLAHNIDCDVLVCGDDPAARQVVIGLAADIGLRGVHAGPIVNSVAAEALTSLLIAMNMRYKVPGTGIRITGLPVEPPQ
ncbi:MAG: NADPH-dependent F420 reductase [Pseudolabrys sp.]|jgi:NADPH-dependent F420 reductase|nr:NADPH-dependent F420 reductase [Pseudolabrys sp.]